MKKLSEKKRKGVCTKTSKRFYRNASTFQFKRPYVLH